MTEGVRLGETTGWAVEPSVGRASLRPSGLRIGHMLFEVLFLNHEEWIADDTVNDGDAGASWYGGAWIKIRTSSAQLPEDENDTEVYPVRVHNEQAIQEVVLHEVLHMCWHQSGIAGSTLVKDEVEENVVYAVTFPLLGVIKENPALFQYLEA